jgi:phosphomannomutase
MNRFGPMVVRYLTRALGLTGDVTRSVMTSHMADAARALYLPDGRLHETPVGFQYFRATIPTSVNSWEESDGMSPKGWNLDKDGMVAALILTAMVLHDGATPEALLEETERELGHFYFERRKVTGSKAGDALSAALAARFRRIAPGDRIDVTGRTFTVDRLITLDGFKVVFDNGWWFGVRASGTEPVVRPYVETFTGPGAGDAGRADARRWQEAIMGWLCDEIARAIA